MNLMNIKMSDVCCESRILVIKANMFQKRNELAEKKGERNGMRCRYFVNN
jgi:hypothetical protein